MVRIMALMMREGRMVSMGSVLCAGGEYAQVVVSEVFAVALMEAAAAAAVWLASHVSTHVAFKSVGFMLAGL